jgi:hypothetical protein
MILEIILNKVEELIDDLERDSQMTKTEVIEGLYKIKGEIEQNHLSEEGDFSFGYEEDY